MCKRSMKYFCSLLIIHCSLFISCEMPKSDLPAPQYDPDLNGWKTASWSPFAVADTINGFAYGKCRNGNGCYIAISSTGIIAWSDDGDIWNKAQIVPDSAMISCNAVCYGNGMFIAAGDGGIFAWSENGKNWTAAGMGGFGADAIRGLAYGNKVFTAVGDNGNISCSDNGKDWASSGAAAFSGIRLNDIAFDESSSRFYVVGNGGNRGWFDNPRFGPWKHRGPEQPIGSADITKVAAGRYGEGPGIGIVYDSKAAIATNAEFSNFDADLETFLFAGNAIRGIAWGGGNFVTAGTSAMIGYWPSAEPSRNSERYWRVLPFDEFRRWEISALEACNGRFFVGNVGGKIGYSK